MILKRHLNYYLLYSILIVSIFSFKINLISLGGSGIRIDDILILFLFLAVISNSHKSTVLLNNKVVFITLIYVGWGLFSVFINSSFYALPILTGVIYSIRGIEYMLFFYLGYYLANSKFDLDIFVKAYILYATVIILLQYLHLVPVVSNFGGNRAIANTGGPWELAVLISFMVYYSFKNLDNKFYFIISMVILLLTQSRITTFAVLVVFLFTFIKKLTLKKILVILLSILFISIYFLYVNSELITRYLEIINMDTFKSLSQIINQFNFTIDREYYFMMTYGSNLSDVLAMEGDSSALIRFTRWFLLIGMTLSTKLSTFIGLGPSFASSAVDGNYVRLFIETGFIGLFIFMYVIYLVYKQFSNDFVMRSFIITIVVTAFFIDIYTTYKVMVMFWFYYGYLLRREKNENTFLR